MTKHGIIDRKLDAYTDALTTAYWTMLQTKSMLAQDLDRAAENGDFLEAKETYERAVYEANMAYIESENKARERFIHDIMKSLNIGK